MKTQNKTIRLMQGALAALGWLGALTVTDRALAASPTIANPSFEANSFTVFPGYHHQAGNGAIVGWTPSGGAGLNPSAGSPFADNGVVPNGSQVAFIQNAAGASLSTVIADLTVGETYKVNFRVNARGGNTATSGSTSTGLTSSTRVSPRWAARMPTSISPSTSSPPLHPRR